LSTTFAGILQDGGQSNGTGGSLTKIGTGTLTLSNINTYTGGTAIEEGTLLVKTSNGSATGTGPVQVNAGTFGGRSNIAGAVTVGTGSGSGAVLAPGVDATGKLTIKNTLTFEADGTYNYELNTNNGRADQVTARGVTVNNGALFSFIDLGNSRLAQGTVFTVIDNTVAAPISGTFSNLPDHSILTIGSNSYEVSYEGGDGNDLTLTVVP